MHRRRGRHHETVCLALTPAAGRAGSPRAAQRQHGLRRQFAYIRHRAAPNGSIHLPLEGIR